MTIFEFVDYRAFLRRHIEGQPKRGRGEYLRIAERLKIHPTVVSQVFSGLREFNEENAIELCEHLQLTSIEAQYFRLLVRLANAGTFKLKQVLKDEIHAVKKQAKSLSERVMTERKLSDQDRAIFYSSWIYSAIRLYCSTSSNGRSSDEIAARFRQSRPRVIEILQFLEHTGLVDQVADKFLMGTQSTFVEKGSPHLLRHHLNWRHKAIQTQDTLTEGELMFTGPCSLSLKDFDLLREQIAGFLKEFSQKVKDSPAQELACLNIDFFLLK